MDNPISIGRELLNRIRAFLNIYAQRCKGCMRREEMNCFDCDSRIANTLIMEIDSVRNANRGMPFIDNPLYERYYRICREIEKAGRPLASKEIPVDGVNRNLKKFTLRAMCKKKILKRHKDESGKNIYEILNGMKSLM